MRIEHHNLDGKVRKACDVYDMPPSVEIHRDHLGREQSYPEYWGAVTDVPCPIPACSGTIRWAEAGYVPGYRVCDCCGRAFMAGGNADGPTLIRFGSRCHPVARRPAVE
jgi:hypothetical protein